MVLPVPILLAVARIRLRVASLQNRHLEMSRVRVGVSNNHVLYSNVSMHTGSTIATAIASLRSPLFRCHSAH